METHLWKRKCEKMEIGSSFVQVSSTTEPLSGLKFGKKVCLESSNGGAAGGISSSCSSSSSKSSTKQPPRCQVEGCSVDLSGAKAYYGRHKVCGMHSKSPMVIVAGLEQRFCQQCSRFHQLAEFDQAKRSCRRRLAGHNERRRKPPPAALSSCVGIPQSVFKVDNCGKLRGFLVNFDYPQLSGRDAWTAIRAGDQMTGKQWEGGTRSYMLEGPGSDLGCARSLLSSHPEGNAHTTTTAAATSAVSVWPNISSSFVTSLWGFKGVEGHEAAGSMQLSSELEIALQRKRQCMELDDLVNRSV